MSKLSMRTVTITPDIAKRMLLMNVKNRPLDLRRATRLSQAIIRGEWQLNGDTIRVSESGVILDGQHRLKAIELSGCNVETILVEGLPDEVFHTIDTNARTRCAGDVLAIKGEKNYLQLAAAATLLYKYLKTGSPIATVDGDRYPTVKQVEDTIEKNSGIRDAVEFVTLKKWVKRYATVSQSAFCLYVFRLYDKNKADEFFEKLDSGIDLEANSPILLLRDRLVIEAGDSKTKITQKFKMALIFKAFRHYLYDKPIKILHIRIDGDRAEKDLFKI